MSMRTSLAVLTALLLGGCAELQVFDATGTRTGIKFYVSKPYLLVTHTGDAQKPLEIALHHIPDVSNPYYVYPKAGVFGSSNLSMNFENGSITGFGQQVESGLSGALDSAGNFHKALAEAAKARMEMATKTGVAAPTVELFEIVQTAEGIGFKPTALPRAPVQRR